MDFSLHELLERQVKLMVQALCNGSQGNIYPLIVGEVEKSLIQTVLNETGYNHLVTAKTLGISRSTLYRKIESLGIKIDRPRKQSIPLLKKKNKPALVHEEESSN